MVNLSEHVAIQLMNWIPAHCRGTNKNVGPEVVPNQLHQQLRYKCVKESSLILTEVFSISFSVPGISNCSLLGLYFLELEINFKTSCLLL